MTFPTLFLSPDAPAQKAIVRLCLGHVFFIATREEGALSGTDLLWWTAEVPLSSGEVTLPCFLAAAREWPRAAVPTGRSSLWPDHQAGENAPGRR